MLYIKGDFFSHLNSLVTLRHAIPTIILSVSLQCASLNIVQADKGVSNAAHYFHEL